MTPQQIEAMKLALEALHYCEALNRSVEKQKMQAITAIKEVLAEHAMRETQRLGQEIEQEPVVYQCPRCATSMQVDLTAKAALAQPEQEPVAWRTFDGEGLYFYCSYEDNETYADVWNKRNPNHKGWVEPLYKDPKPCPTCEALARTVMLDQTSHDTATPQQTWVGLNDDEIDYLIHLAYTGDEEFVQTIEAKLKEKNLPCIKPKWIGLTEKEHTDIAVECGCMSADWVFYGAAVERKLKERNT
jgi:rubrerythrin